MKTESRPFIISGHAVLGEVLRREEQGHRAGWFRRLFPTWHTQPARPAPERREHVAQIGRETIYSNPATPRR